MRPVGAWLERFRRPAAVPAAASDELDTELMPVFAALDEIETEARHVREEARREADRRLDSASVRVETTLADARRRAEAERARAEIERREALAGEALSIEAGAEAEAAALRERGLERMPEFVAAVVACITEEEASV
jgi:hypothetical protein